MTPALWIVLAASLGAAATDLARRRIPNGLVAALAIAGLALNARHGWPPFLASLGIAAAVLAAGTFVHALGAIGGGDVKLLAAAAATLNYPDCIPFVLYTLLCGGLLALALSALRGRLRPTLANLHGMLLPMLAGVAPVAPSRSIAMPYAVAIAAGTLLLALTKAVAPQLGIFS